MNNNNIKINDYRLIMRTKLHVKVLGLHWTTTGQD